MRVIKKSTNYFLHQSQKSLYHIGFVCVAAIYAALAIGAGIAKSPWCDEAWFASPAFNLSKKGFMGTTVLESSGTWLEGIDTYWIPPAYILAQTGWFAVFGFSLPSMRALSAAFGLLALFCWFIFIKEIS